MLLWQAVPPPACAQTTREVGIHGTVTTSDPVTWVAGVSGAIRPSTRARLTATLGAGAAADAFAWRGEVLWQFLLHPGRRSGVAPYAGGGLALRGGPDEEGYVVLLVGIESRPGGPRGVALELGVGGGIRVSVAYRWRGHGAGVLDR